MSDVVLWTGFVRVESWAGSQRVRVSVLGETKHRYKIRLEENCQKGKAGTIRYVGKDVVVRRDA